MKSQDLLGGMNLTCNSFTSAVHIVREVSLKRLHGTDKARDARLWIQTTFFFSEFTLATCVYLYRAKRANLSVSPHVTDAAIMSHPFIL